MELDGGRRRKRGRRKMTTTGQQQEDKAFVTVAVTASLRFLLTLACQI